MGATVTIPHISISPKENGSLFYSAFRLTGQCLPLGWPARKRPFLEFSLCLSRADLGKRSVLYANGSKKTGSTYLPAKLEGARRWLEGELQINSWLRRDKPGVRHQRVAWLDVEVRGVVRPRPCQREDLELWSFGAFPQLPPMGVRQNPGIQRLCGWSPRK